MPVVVHIRDERNLLVILILGKRAWWDWRTCHHCCSQLLELLNVDRKRVRTENRRSSFVALNFILFGCCDVAGVDVAQAAEDRLNLASLLLWNFLYLRSQASTSHCCEFSRQTKHQRITDRKNLRRDNRRLPVVRENCSSCCNQDWFASMTRNVTWRRLRDEVSHSIPQRIVRSCSLCEVESARSISCSSSKAVTHRRYATRSILISLRLCVENWDSLFWHIDELMNEIYGPF